MGEKRIIKIRIINTQSRNIMFGVLDQKSIWISTAAYTTAGGIAYYGVGGQVYHNNGIQKTEGGGFNTGDLV